jgi:hypothetical protein
MKKVNFDLGIYLFRRQVSGPICPEDDRRTTNGEVIAVLHPLQNVDPSGLYCFGISKSDRNTKTLVKRNLKFSKVITLSFERQMFMTAVEEVHAKLNVAVKYLSQGEQLALQAGGSLDLQGCAAHQS